MSRSFLELLFETKPDGSYILIWTKRQDGKKISKWFDDPTEATRYAEQQGEKCDTYFGFGLSPSVKAADKRVESNEVCGIPGLWLDLDIQSPVHKKKNLPPTIDDALQQIVYRMPDLPTMVVSTGHGLHAYWLFKIVAAIETGEQRIFYAELVERWQRLAKAYAEEQGWSIDSTFDLARVFRVPNTLNHKEKDKEPVEIIKRWFKHRYPPEEVNTLLDVYEGDTGQELTSSVAQQAEKKKVMKGVGIALNPKANIDMRKFDVLCALEPLFKQSWEHKRTTKSLPDQTPSGYDLSLATFAANAGWSDQEIADLLLVFREKHHHDLKLSNRQYYQRTIAAARVSASKQVSIKKPVSDDRAENLRDIGESLGLKLLDLIKYLTEPPQYVLISEVEDKDHGTFVMKEIEIPKTAFHSQNEMTQVLWDYADVNMPHYKPAEWSAIKDKILVSFRRIKMGSESTHLDIFSHWLYKFLKAHYREDAENESQVRKALSDRPALLDNKICITIDSFSRFVSTTFNERPRREVLLQRLQRLGCIAFGKKSLYDDSTKKTTSRYMWVVPNDFMTNHESRMDEQIVDEVDEHRQPVPGLQESDTVN